ncbi:DUF3157 family protein [Vibrio intestinalis]|uniref:DUF3157 family protein n=1 Tax=Vibrio intestinalis TaxID=2933291 RepID=UPI0021A80983|nr:DUF3157 family protein [Vibrio intestinalis]
MKKLIPLLGLLVSSTTLAAQVITLEDGRQVQLNDDFTWGYVLTEKAAQTDNRSTPSNAEIIPVAAAPVINKRVGTTITVGSKKPIMQLQDSGIELLLGSAQYQDGELIIPTSLTNQSSSAVVLVEVEITISDLQGQKLAQEKVKVWQSIKRLADTYLRPQTAEQGRSIAIAVEQAEQYQLSAQIVDLEIR